MITYKKIDSLPEFDVLTSSWNSLLDESASHVPFLRHEYQKAWWQTLGGGEWNKAELNIITGAENGNLIGIAPLFSTSEKGSVNTLWFIGSVEVSDFLDILVRPEDTARFCEGLLKYLATDLTTSWKKLELFNILDDSPSLPAFATAASIMGWKVHEETLQHCPYIPLHGDFDGYLASINKKQRHEIRRKQRRLESSGLNHRWYTTTEEVKLLEDINSFLDLMVFDEKKEAFLVPSMRLHMENVTRCAFQANCLQLKFLEIEGVKIAGSLSFDYLDRLWLYNSGINPVYAEYSPGWLMLAELIRWACEHQYRELDFMRGDEEYKYRFGALDRFVKRLQITR